MLYKVVSLGAMSVYLPFINKLYKFECGLNFGPSCKVYLSSGLISLNSLGPVVGCPGTKADAEKQGEN